MDYRMNTSALKRDAENVGEDFVASRVTAGTVLAAHLRRAGMHSSGEDYELARQALDGDLPLEEAVDEAAKTRGVRDPSSAKEPEDISLSWFPKRFGPGDVHGAGALKLLGNPNVPLPTLLLRETAQNSWDARLCGSVPSYGMHLRGVTRDQRELLRRKVFVEGAHRLGLADSLAKKNLKVIEIHDRGTCGLDGPTRNDQPVPAGESTNFIDLVLNVGVPPTDTTGGGTYGFGKMAAYMATYSGAVIFWTRVKTATGMETRFIASGVGDSFDMSEGRYTGRHWWGVPDGEGSRILPLYGPEAEVLGGALFSRGFEPGETGTSMLLLDPKLEDERGKVASEDFMESVRDAVLLNLWPKLVGTAPERQMKIDLRVDGDELPIPNPESVSFLRPFVRCLESVRDHQSGSEVIERFAPTLWTLSSLRPKRELGQLAVISWPVASDPHDIGLGKESHHVSLMRSGAEIVVKYMEFAPKEIEGFQWAAVFKPHPDLDDVFARAEPPAHDDWIPTQLERPAKTFVNVAYREIKSKINEFLRPPLDVAGGKGKDQSVAKLADKLSLFVTGVPGAAPLSRKPGAHAKKPLWSRTIPEIVDSQVMRVDDVWRWSAVRIESKSHMQSLEGAEIVVQVVMESGSIQDNDLACVVGWTSSVDDEPEMMEQGDGLLRSNDGVWAVIRSRRDLVIDVQIRQVAR